MQKTLPIVSAMLIAASVTWATSGLAQDAAAVQLAPTIATQAEPGTTTILNPTSGLLTTTTVTSSSIITVITVAATGLVIATVVESIAEDDDGSGESGATGTSGS